MTVDARWMYQTPAGLDAMIDGGLAEVRKLDVPKRLEGKSTNEFVFSTEKVARDGDIIEQSSWKLSDYRKCSPILDNHTPGLLVGRGEVVRVIDNELRGIVLWDDNPINPRGQMVAHWHRERFRTSTSVSWLTGTRTARNKLPEDHPHFDKGRKVEGYFGEYLEVGDYLQRCTLLEVSSVDVPSDPRALQQRFLTGKEAARQLPDEGARVDLLAMLDEAAADGRLAESDAFRQAVTDILIRAARTEDEFTRAMAAIATEALPTLAAPATPATELQAWWNSKD